jgi:hypothetical protein
MNRESIKYGPDRVKEENGILESEQGSFFRGDRVAYFSDLKKTPFLT